jgi:hypothetical protein
MTVHIETEHDVADLLDQAAEFNRRAKSCPPQHARSLYQKKDTLLQQAIAQSPGEFMVDSVLDVQKGIVGVTHRRSSRRFHLGTEQVTHAHWDQFARLVIWLGDELARLNEEEEHASS